MAAKGRHTMNSNIYRIEQRSGRKWLTAAIICLGRTMTDDNANATLHAISILRNAMEDAQ